MSRIVVLDTGPLVALLDRRDHFHDWAKTQFAGLSTPVWTCEAVLAEACHLVRKLPDGGRLVLELLRRGVVEVPFRLADDGDAVWSLMSKYADVPMSLADACLVRMAEQNSNCAILTVDRDFWVYRRHGQLSIPTLMPEDL